MKITKINDQLRITIPKEIAELKGWDETTDIQFVPFLEKPDASLGVDTPIILKEIRQKKK